MISLEKRIILTPLQKLPENVRDLGKLIAAKGFKKLPKVQKIAQSGHTVIKQLKVQVHCRPRPSKIGPLSHLLTRGCHAMVPATRCPVGLH